MSTNEHLRKSQIRANTPSFPHEEQVTNETDATHNTQQALISRETLTTGLVLQMQRMIGNQATKRLLSKPHAVASPIPKESGSSLPFLVQRNWDRYKTNGGPRNFDPDRALRDGDFSNPVFVQAAKAINQAWDYTVYVYTYVMVGRWRVCVVGHAHITGDPNNDNSWGPGNCFIPGWRNWSRNTPNTVLNTIRTAWKSDVVSAIQGDPDLTGTNGNITGAFPDNGRYPTWI